MGTDHSEPEASANLLFLSGIYSRVARQLGVHPSYVSRVARGERRSDRVFRAIAAELAKLRGPIVPEPGAEKPIRSLKIAAARDLRERLAQTLKADSRLRRLNTVILDATEAPRRSGAPKFVSLASLSARLAANCRMIASTIPSFERLSKRWEQLPHVLCLHDADAVALYSTGTTGMARREHRLAGADWSLDYRGPSSAARSIAAGVPVVVIGAFDLEGTFVPSVRMAVPVRLSDSSIAGALCLTIEVTRARPEHLLDLAKIAKRICKFVENGPIGTARKMAKKSVIETFEDAARNVAMVLSLPQIDPQLRLGLSALLGELENGGRAALIRDLESKRKGRMKRTATSV